MVITTWQFARLPRFTHKIIPTSEISSKTGIDPDMLDEEDYILDWQKGSVAYRYCHFTSDDEMSKLVEDLELSLLETFRDDGSTRNINKYFVYNRI